MRAYLVLALLIAFLFFSAPSGMAQQQTQPAQASVKKASPAKKTYEYQEPSLESFSKLYWALSALDINDNKNIDDFIRINDCDVYKKYFLNEFEWGGIRDAARAFLAESGKSFQTRFQITQPLRLGEYVFEKKAFVIDEEYKIKGVSRYEISIEDPFYGVCSQKGNLNNYPPTIIAELNRPINLEYMPISPEAAQKFIAEKQKLNNISNSAGGTSMRFQRDAFVVLKMKFFGFKKFGFHRESAINYAELLGVLEKLEVYADEELTELLYEEDFLKRRVVSDKEMELRKQREAQKRLKESKAGIVKAPEQPAPAQEAPAQASPPQ